MRSQATRRDVAQLAGVSETTVSFVINERRDVAIREDTRSRVLDAAKQLGYQPSRAGRALVTGRTNLIALWMPAQGTPFFSQVIDVVYKELLHYEYEVIVSLRGERSQWLSTASNSGGWPVDGVLAFCGATWGAPHVKADSIPGVPTVIVEKIPVEGVDSVLVDLYTPARQAIEHLVAAGRRRIPHMLTHWTDRADEPRLRAYKDVIREAGLRAEFIRPADHTRPTARQTIIDYVLANGYPEAIFCANDDMAIGASRGLKDLGIRIPDEVALVGCDGIEETLYHDPPISTIVQPVTEMCEKAWQLLHRRIQKPDASVKCHRIEAQFVLRGSSTDDGGRPETREIPKGVIAE